MQDIQPPVFKDASTASMAPENMSGRRDSLRASVTPVESASTTPKARHQASRSPQATQKLKMSDYDSQDDLMDISRDDLDLDNGVIELDIREQLEREKHLYPGASTWAEDEEKLFEILFCRQDLQILPAHWEVDLRGVPIAEANFTASDEEQALVYAHSQEFRATTALVRLIDLTSNVRTTAQSGLRHRVAGMIKKGVDQFLSWAAEDGGYSHLRVVPNIITEVIDKKMQESDITELMQSRMRALARLQREFLRTDRDPSFWDVGESEAAGGDGSEETTMENLLIQKYLSPRGKRASSKRSRSASMDDELAALPVTDGTGTPVKSQAPKRRRAFKSPSNGLDELAQTSSTPPSASRESKRLPPQTPPARHSEPVKYSRKLPVVYGLFVLNTSVLVLTVDSAKGDDAYVSFHVETDFMSRRQSVWNALTLAIIACRARDELRQRIADFDTVDGPLNESDPDV